MCKIATIPSKKLLSQVCTLKCVNYVHIYLVDQMIDC